MRVEGTFAQLAECDCDALGHRHRAARASGLRVAELAADEGGDHADLARVEVDIAPAQPEQLALAQPGHRGGHVQGWLDPAERVVGVRRGEQLLELGLIQELDPGLGLLQRGPIGELDRVRRAPALPQPEVEDRVHRVDVVADRLDRERTAFGSDVALDVLGPDPVERLAAEERRDVVAKVGGDGQSVRPAPAPQLEPLAELGAGLLHGHALGAGRRARCVDVAHPPEHTLCLSLRQPVGAPLRANVAHLALDAPAIGPVPRSDPRTADDPQSPGAVGSTSHQPTSRAGSRGLAGVTDCD